MAGSTADASLMNFYKGLPKVEMDWLGGFRDILGRFDDAVRPTESNSSGANIGNIMQDPRDLLSLEEFLDVGFYIKMPCRKRIAIEATINSVSRGFPKFPDFED